MLIAIVVFVAITFAQIQGIYSRQPGAVGRSLLGTCGSVSEDSPKAAHIIRLVVQQNVNSSDPTPPQPFLVKIPSSGTLLNIVESRKVKLPPGIWIEDVTIHVDGHHFTGKDLDLIHIRHLSLTGTFNITWSDPSDIQLLFRIFSDPDHTERAFGNKTYQEFEEHFPRGKHRVNTLQESRSTFVMDGDRIERIRISDGLGPLSDFWHTVIDWDVIQRMDRLTHLRLDRCGIVGSVPFEKLPRTLVSLELRYNQLSGVHNTSMRPPGLRRLKLRGNRLDGCNTEVTSLDYVGLLISNSTA